MSEYEQSTGGIGCFAPSCQNGFVAVGYDTVVNCPVAFCGEHVDEWSEKENIKITGRRSGATGTGRSAGRDGQ